jgi:clan AA aspartic protease
MFVTGFIDDDFIPYLNDIFIIDKNNTPIPIKAVLDTGFNGELVLPSSLESSCDLTYLGAIQSVLGDGSIIEDATYEGKIIIGNEPYTVTISFTEDDEALIGMALLYEKIITLNLKNSTITITS